MPVSISMWTASPETAATLSKSANEPNETSTSSRPAVAAWDSGIGYSTNTRPGYPSARRRTASCSVATQSQVAPPRTAHRAATSRP